MIRYLVTHATGLAVALYALLAFVLGTALLISVPMPAGVVDFLRACVRNLPPLVLAVTILIVVVMVRASLRRRGGLR